MRVPTQYSLKLHVSNYQIRCRHGISFTIISFQLQKLPEQQRFLRLQYLLKQSNIYSKFLLDRMEEQSKKKKIEQGRKLSQKKGTAHVNKVCVSRHCIHLICLCVRVVLSGDRWAMEKWCCRSSMTSIRRLVRIDWANSEKLPLLSTV